MQILMTRQSHPAFSEIHSLEEITAPRPLFDLPRSDSSPAYIAENNG